jgi:hypothetical protein
MVASDDKDAHSTRDMDFIRSSFKMHKSISSGHTVGTVRTLAHLYGYFVKGMNEENGSIEMKSTNRSVNTSLISIDHSGSYRGVTERNDQT